MSNLLVIAGAGFAASFVDGALGMGFGPTSSTILLASGLSPKASSATVNIAKVAVGAAAGLSHWRFGNIDKRLVVRLALPGCVGAIVGTTVLANVDGKQLRPWLAVILLVVGVRMLLRFRGHVSSAKSTTKLASASTRGTIVAGGLGGVTNGMVGAWGPVVTPYLLHEGIEPRVAIGSVNTAEVAVALTSAGSLLTLIASGSLDIGVVVAMLAGGVVAAPVSAWSLRFLSPRFMGLCVSALLLLTNVGPAGRLIGLQRFGALPEFVVLIVVAAVSVRGAVATPAFQKRESNGANVLVDPVSTDSPRIRVGH